MTLILARTLYVSRVGGPDAQGGLPLRDDANPDGDIEIEVVGLRPGEKLYEELLIGVKPVPTNHALIMKANVRSLVWHELSGLLEKLDLSTWSDRGSEIVETLLTLVPEFSIRDRRAA
jgi:FlaA1/EpsC-like NDP-sugar epimerase